MRLAEAFALQDAIESQRPDLDVTITGEVMVFIRCGKRWMPVPSEEHWEEIRHSIEVE